MLYIIFRYILGVHTFCDSNWFSPKSREGTEGLEHWDEIGVSPGAHHTFSRLNALRDCWAATSHIFHKPQATYGLLTYNTKLQSGHDQYLINI